MLFTNFLQRNKAAVGERELWCGFFPPKAVFSPATKSKAFVRAFESCLKYQCLGQLKIRFPSPFSDLKSNSANHLLQQRPNKCEEIATQKGNLTFGEEKQP